MKKYLKNKDGMALPTVLAIMVILTILGTALAMFAYNSYVTVRWVNDEKKAYYLSKAGVEAAAYAYQDAVAKTSSKYSDISKVAEFSDIDKLVAIAEDSDAIITTNKVYMIYDKTPETEDTMWNGISFTANADVSGDTNCIGYFEVEIGTGTDVVSSRDTEGNKIDSDVKVRVFRSTAVVNDKTQVSTGYIIPPENASSLKLYDENGYWTQNGVSPEEAETSGTGGKFIKKTERINYDIDYELKEVKGNFFQRIIARIQNGRIKLIYRTFTNIFGTGRDVDTYFKQSEGNIILSKPDKSRYIKTNDNKDNFYIFATTGNLFLKDVGLQVTPTKDNYATIGLFADQIVIDDDIIMELYYTNPDSLLGNSNAGAIVEMLGRRYRLGTVVLGDANTMSTTRRDKLPVSKGGLQVNGQAAPANKVYFNGNVLLKIYTQGAATETYRVFNAGDMAYFCGSYSESGTGGQESTGIDLVKYFIDAVLTESDGHIYGENLKKKMRKINELYYGGNDPTYITEDTRLIRKIDVQYDAKGEITVDKGYGSVLDIIQPSETGSSSIVWGLPRKGCNF